MKYEVQEKNDSTIILDNQQVIKPVLTMSNGYNKAYIINDDHCYVLVIQRTSDGFCRIVSHWFREAVEAVRNLPLPD